MTDVRLTATNPEDSTVVPVACNSRGELLITEPVIEQIDNDVTIKGMLTIDANRGSNNFVWSFSSNADSLFCKRQDYSFLSHVFKSGGNYIATRNFKEDTGPRVANICSSSGPFYGQNEDDVITFQVSWQGDITSPNFFIALEADNAESYELVDEPELGSQKVYRGSVLNVREELEFLRTQLRQTMEKLKMVPDGGWEVWDGSDD